MTIKDKYGNNIRRSDRVKDARPEMRQEGTVNGTYDKSASVEWDSGEEESVMGHQLVRLKR